MTQTVTTIPASAQQIFAGTLPPGPHTFGPSPVPAGISLIVIYIDRSLWTDPNSTIDYGFLVSQDGGADGFPTGIRGTARGDGGSSIPSAIGVAVGNPANANRKIKGDVLINGTVVANVFVNMQ